jgi:hypothetical protein
MRPTARQIEGTKLQKRAQLRKNNFGEGLRMHLKGALIPARIVVGSKGFRGCKDIELE